MKVTMCAIAYYQMEVIFCVVEKCFFFRIHVYIVCVHQLFTVLEFTWIVSSIDNEGNHSVSRQPQTAPIRHDSYMVQSLVKVMRANIFSRQMGSIFMGFFMMTSSNGNIFRVTGHWSPVDSPHIGQCLGAFMFLWSATEQTTEQTIEPPVIWDAIALIMTSLYCPF